MFIIFINSSNLETRYIFSQANFDTRDPLPPRLRASLEHIPKIEASHNLSASFSDPGSGPVFIEEH